MQCVLYEKHIILKGDFTKVMEALQTAVERIDNIDKFIRDALMLKKRYDKELLL